jgi:hypothetical protein
MVCLRLMMAMAAAAVVATVMVALAVTLQIQRLRRKMLLVEMLVRVLDLLGPVLGLLERLALMTLTQV